MRVRYRAAAPRLTSQGRLRSRNSVVTRGFQVASPAELSYVGRGQGFVMDGRADQLLDLGKRFANGRV
jgi:hypothetical protein